MKQDNRTPALKFFESIDHGDWDAMHELMHPDHVFSIPFAPEPLDRDGHIDLNRGFTESFSEFRHEVAQQVAQQFAQQLAKGDWVVSRGVVENAPHV